MRATRLTVLTATAALLGACAGSGIRSEGGDVFTLRTDSLSGSRAVEHGLAEARDFCVANGRQLVVQDSRIGSGSYQLMFRCVAPFGTAWAGGVDPLLAAAATPPAPATTTGTRRRVRRASAAETAAIAPAGDPVEAPRPVRRARRAQPANAGYAPAETSALQPIPQATFASRFTQPEPAPLETPALPPVAATPLFNPRGASFPAPVAAPTRQIPADGRAFAPIQQTVATGAAAQPVAAQPAALPRAAASDALPPIQLQPPVVSSPLAAPVAASASGYGAAVPSPRALPSANSALAPIASPLRPMPSATPPVNPSTPPTGFFTAPGR